MKKTLIALLFLSVVSSFYMVRFYFASIDIYNEYVNENTLVYLNSLNGIDNLPQWTTMRGLWQDVQTDYLIRFIFGIVMLVFLIKLTFKSERPSRLLSLALALSFYSFLLMLFYFAASADIYNEYVNGEIIRLVQQGNVGTLLASASCDMEWGFTKIDFILRAISMIVITVFLVKLILANEKQIVPLK